MHQRFISSSRSCLYLFIHLHIECILDFGHVIGTMHSSLAELLEGSFSIHAIVPHYLCYFRFTVWIATLDCCNHIENKSPFFFVEVVSVQV